MLLFLVENRYPLNSLTFLRTITWNTAKKVNKTILCRSEMFV